MGCLNDGLKTLVGHINMHFFKSIVGLLSWPILCITSPKLPTRVPSLAPYCLIWGNDVLRFVGKEKFTNTG